MQINIDNVSSGKQKQNHGDQGWLKRKQNLNGIKEQQKKRKRNLIG
jgi:hypothetical protein